MTDRVLTLVEPPRDLAWQLGELEKLAHDRFIQRNDNVKGDFTSGDFVEWRLRNIFGPQNISVELRDGPRVVTISESQAYAQALIRLSVRFADGTETFQDAVGVWPLAATKASQGGTLENTAAERYETVLKACQTDGIKAAAERLGTCFRPLFDLALKAFIVEREYRQKHPRQTGQTETDKEALFGNGKDTDSSNGNQSKPKTDLPPIPIPPEVPEGQIVVPWRNGELVAKDGKLNAQRDAEAFRVIQKAIAPAAHLKAHLKKHYGVEILTALTMENLVRLYSNSLNKES